MSCKEHKSKLHKWVGGESPVPVQHPSSANWVPSFFKTLSPKDHWFRRIRGVVKGSTSALLASARYFGCGTLCLSTFFLFTTVGYAENKTNQHASHVIDAHGRKISVEKPFKKIISLYGAHTENLFFLGLDREIIGVSRKESYPEAAKKKPWFSYHDGPEKYLGAAPDLVLVRPMIERGYPALIQRLERSGITVASLQPANVGEMYDYWISLGRLTGKESQARAMVEAFKKRVAYYRSLTSDFGEDPSLKRRVYFEAIHTKMKTFTPGAMALFALETAGGINVATDAEASRGTNIGNYGKERILYRASEIDVFFAQKGVMNHTSVEIIKSEPGFGIIKAVKNNEIYIIDEMTVSRPCFRLLQGIEKIGEILYPEQFRQ